MSWHISKALMTAYENSRSSPGLVEAFLEENSSDGEQYAPLRSNPIPRLYLSSDRMTAFSRLSRFGMTLQPLTEDLGAELLTWFLAGFPVRTFQQQERAQESPEQGPDSGKKWPESLAKYDPVSALWKTRQCLLFEDSGQSLAIFPRWGMMRDGGYFPDTTSRVARKYARDCSYLPACTATEWKAESFTTEQMLKVVINGHANRLAYPLKCSGYPMGAFPRLMEWIMAWPIGWTKLEPLAMDKFRPWLNSHGKSSPALNP